MIAPGWLSRRRTTRARLDLQDRRIDAIFAVMRETAEAVEADETAEAVAGAGQTRRSRIEAIGLHAV